MKIGILSDTHGRLDAAREALALLRAGGAEYFIHCGDVGSQGVLDLLAGLPAAVVWGNTDWEWPAMGRYAKGIGVLCHGFFADLTLDGKRIAVIHGDDLKLKRKLLSGQAHDYLLQGHTHQPEDRRQGRTRIINPGALHRVVERTVALLDTAGDLVSFLRCSMSRPPL